MWTAYRQGTPHTHKRGVSLADQTSFRATCTPVANILYYVSRNEKEVEDGTKGATIPLQTWWKQEDSSGIGLKNLVVFV